MSEEVLAPGADGGPLLDKAMLERVKEARSATQPAKAKRKAIK